MNPVLAYSTTPVKCPECGHVFVPEYKKSNDTVLLALLPIMGLIIAATLCKVFTGKFFP